MNILMVGNGFDLAHGIPTDYMSFLDFLKILSSPEVYQNNLRSFRSLVQRSELCNKHESIKQFLQNASQNTGDRYALELLGLIKDNVWIEYLTHLRMSSKNWVDFEGEISNVIQVIDLDDEDLNIRNVPKNVKNDFRGTLEKMNISDLAAPQKRDRLIERLLLDLNKLIRCLEIYLCLCLKLVTIQSELSHVNSIINDSGIDAVLSFNYTNLFEMKYENILLKKPSYCYIHGKAKLNNDIDGNSMVLGIDEYLEEPARSEKVDFVVFKKYYQRIFKQTDFDYTNWIEAPGPKNLYIIGHSLDVTDCDVLRELILHQDVKTTIFYHSRKANGKQIANLVKVLGYNDLNTLSRGKDKTRSITFEEL